MLIKKSILKIIVAGVVTIVNAANADADAAHTRGLRAESLVPAVNVSAYVPIDEVDAFESLSPTNDRSDDSLQAESLESLVSTTSIIKDEISSRIEAEFLDDVVSFTQSSSSPTHDSMHGCVKAKDDVELSVYISNAQNIGDGQVRLCPGTIHFRNEIVLGDSLTHGCSIFTLPPDILLDECAVSSFFTCTTHIRSSRSFACTFVRADEIAIGSISVARNFHCCCCCFPPFITQVSLSSSSLLLLLLLVNSFVVNSNE